ncbi:hypothetical protein [Comamonas koreensis]|uniref:Uncharacterized protein n=1 Tax=Comamonas koreensis TaxID=160825 RepID=A0AAW4XX55_9BURK|nr:hypothetical protein [Comamonas koreensis]MCD2165269.1 hypothetical protein [Comamonas koreensis]
MHMLLVMLTGLLLLAVFALLGKLWGADADSIMLAAKYFIPVWLGVALVNMWVGVHKAGYTVAQELPILLVNFAVPAALALGLVWWLGRA